MFLCCWVALCSLSRSLGFPVPTLGIPFKTEKRKTLLRTCASLGLSIFRAGEICARFEKNIFLLWILLRGMTTLAGLVFSQPPLLPPQVRLAVEILVFFTNFSDFKKAFLAKVGRELFRAFFFHVFGGSPKAHKMYASA